MSYRLIIKKSAKGYYKFFYVSYNNKGLSTLSKKQDAYAVFSLYLI